MDKPKKKYSKAKAAALTLGIVGGALAIHKGVQWFDEESKKFPIPVGRAMDITLAAARGKMTTKNYRDLSMALPLRRYGDTDYD